MLKYKSIELLGSRRKIITSNLSISREANYSRVSFFQRGDFTAHARSEHFSPFHQFFDIDDNLLKNDVILSLLMFTNVLLTKVIFSPFLNSCSFIPH